MYQEFNDFMLNLGLPPEEYERGVAAGVSGGSDSMALAILMNSWCEERDIPFLAMVCDHGLRKESYDEAGLTIERLEKRGIDCQLLQLKLQPGTAIQERARNARYKAMFGYMRYAGIPVLAIAHHAMDQAETIAHRLSTGQATELGKAGMLPVKVFDDALLIRPLLECGKGSLKDFLREERISWVEDPSNENELFTRVRWRKQLALQPEMVAELLNQARKGLELYREVMEEKQHILNKSVITRELFGASQIDLKHIPHNLAGAETVRDILYHASGRRPSAVVKKLLSCLQHSQTFGGAEISIQGNTAWVFKELSQMPSSVSANAFSAWDNRIRMGKEKIDNAYINCLGQSDATFIRNKYNISLPHKILTGVPCIREKGQSLRIPQLGIGKPIEILPTIREEPKFVINECIDVNNVNFS